LFLWGQVKNPWKSCWAVLASFENFLIIWERKGMMEQQTCRVFIEDFVVFGYMTQNCHGITFVFVMLQNCNMLTTVKNQYFDYLLYNVFVSGNTLFVVRRKNWSNGLLDATTHLRAQKNQQKNNNVIFCSKINKYTSILTKCIWVLVNGHKYSWFPIRPYFLCYFIFLQKKIFWSHSSTNFH
jgi:hypothetical protein